MAESHLQILQGNKATKPVLELIMDTQDNAFGFTEKYVASLCSTWLYRGRQTHEQQRESCQFLNIIKTNFKHLQRLPNTQNVQKEKKKKTPLKTLKYVSFLSMAEAENNVVIIKFKNKKLCSWNATGGVSGHINGLHNMMIEIKGRPRYKKHTLFLIQVNAAARLVEQQNTKTAGWVQNRETTVLSLLKV